MNKILNIANMDFTLDPESYQALQDYLDSIRIYFSNIESSQEIVDDINCRIAEILNDHMQANDHIDLSAVKDTMDKIGQPEDFYPIAENNNTIKEPRHRPIRDSDNVPEVGVFAAYKWGFKHAFKPFWRIINHDLINVSHRLP